MTTPDDARALDAATAELRSAHTLIVDHRCDPATAVVHLKRTWWTIAWLSRREQPDAPGEGLGAWLAPEHLALIPARTHAEVHATLSAILRHPDEARPWVETEPPPELPGERDLVRHLRVLRELVHALDLQQRGRPPKTQIVARWAVRAIVWVAAVAALALLVFRPWQGMDNRWRGAYYPDVSFEGDPDLRRDVDVDFDWTDSQPTDTILARNFSARWDTCLVLDEEVEAAFQVVSSSRTRVYLDGEQIINSWDGAWSEVNGERVTLVAGRHHLRVEFGSTRAQERRGGPKLHLVASFDPNERPGPIPRRMLEFPGMDIDELSDPCED